jgi:hypothetical protein
MSATAEDEDIHRVLASIDGAGIDWRPTRFGRYRGIIEQHRMRTDEFVRNYQADESVQKLTFEACAQLAQLVFSEAAWSLLDPGRLRRHLQEIVAGPELTESDDDKPRNTLLELVTAALLSDRGFDVDITKDREDVTLQCPGAGQGAAECKRPLRCENILPNLRKIGEQLRERERSGSRFGVAVLGLDRATGLCREACEAETVDDLDRALTLIRKDAAARVAKAVRDPACNVVPAAVYRVVVVSGAVLIRNPLHFLPFCTEEPRALVDESQIHPEIVSRMNHVPKGPLDRFRMS